MVRNLITAPDIGDYFVPAWSLAVEEWFYLVFPVFLFGLTRFRLSIIAAAIAFVCVLLAIQVAYAVIVPDMFEQGRRIVLLRVSAIALGFILALIAPKFVDKRRALPGGAMLCALSLGLSIFAFEQQHVFLFLYAAPAFGVTLIFVFLILEPGFARHQATALAASFGANTSYTIYLAHMAIIVVFTTIAGPIISIAHFMLYILAVLGFSALFFVLVEAPILRARPRYGHKPTTSSVAQGSQSQKVRVLAPVLSNVLVVIFLAGATEAGSWAVKWLYVNVRNTFSATVGMRPIDAPQTAFGTVKLASIYSSPDVSRDLKLNQAMPGSPYRYENHLVFQNRPFTSEHVNIDPINMRLNGSRNPADDQRKQVWVFGSSPVFGATNADNETIPAGIERALWRHFRGNDFAVANFGVVGYSSLQDFLHFRMRLDALPKPDLVIFFNGHNDYNSAWLATDKDCGALLETAVGSSQVLFESWEIRSHGGVVIWPAVYDGVAGFFSNTLELLRLTRKFIDLRKANADIDAWKKDYRSRREAAATNAAICSARAQASFLRNMRLVADLARSEGIRIAFVHQPIIHTTKKPLLGAEKGESDHLDRSAFTIDERELDAMTSLPTYRLEQARYWVKSQYIQGYTNQKDQLRKLAEEIGSRFIDVDTAINNAGQIAIFSSTIHFTFRGAELIGEEIARGIVDLLPN